MKLAGHLVLSLLLLLDPVSGFEEEVLHFLEQHCVRCHGGEKTKGEIDLSKIRTLADAEANPDLWEAVSFVLEDREMPPEEEPQPEEHEIEQFLDWYEKEFLGDIEARPSVFTPRRLSGPEYRNTMRSLFGFDLEVNIAEAEQTVTEKSLVLKLLPTDPPGRSGFINDTQEARLSTTIFDQYSYLAEFAIEQLFSPVRREQLSALTGSDIEGEITELQGKALVRKFSTRAFRRSVSDEQIADSLAAVEGKSGDEIVSALKVELKTTLMSPGFLYRGILMPTDPSLQQQPVDDFELAERISYFLWEDMPDEELMAVASRGQLREPDQLSAQIDRMIASPKSRTLAESFGSQWLLLDQINSGGKDPTSRHAFRTQPLDFLAYLFRENRPVVELIDSKVTFANAYTAGFYGNDRRQLKKFNKPRGIEKMAMPNQKIELVESAGERGGIITMPGVLAMNRGPILRGTWMLRQIMGEHLGEPPPDIPPIKGSPKGQNLTFRQRFEAHRADKSCALCHDKIDPLGFALEGYDQNGTKVRDSGKDTSGKLPGGETFTNYGELKNLLLTTQRETIVRNAVEQTLRYALCRKLERHDLPVVNSLTAEILEKNGTWQDLIHGIANSVLFTETLIAKDA